MRICIVASGNFYSSYGGGQVYVKNLVDELIRRKEELTVISCHPSFSATPTKKSYKGVDIYEIAPDGDIASCLKEIKPDVVHAHGEKSLFSKCCRDLNIPCIVTAHHGGILCPAGSLLNHNDEICHTKACHKDCLPCYLRNIRSGSLWFPLLRHLDEDRFVCFGEKLHKHRFIPFVTPIGESALSIRGRFEHWEAIKENATIIVAPSRAIAESLILNGADKGKVKVIPHGIPLPNLTPCDTTNNDSIKRFYYVGRICRVKGIHVLLDAFSQLRDANVELHLIGGASGKNEKQYQENLMHKYRNDSRIIWHGKIPAQEINSFVSGFDIMVHPAIYLEVFGLNIAEAQALGKYVIATRCGGAEMQIGDGVNGTLVEPNNIPQLRDAMEQAIKSHPTFSKKVRSIEQHSDDLLSLYKDVADPSDPFLNSPKA